MDLKKYFAEHDGLGVLSTADAEGRANSAVFARPYVDDTEALVFVVAKHRSLENLQANPSAAYLFKEEGPGYKGIRLDLKLARVVDDARQVDEFRKEHSGELYERYREVDAVLALFTIEKQRPLVGAGK